MEYRIYELTPHKYVVQVKVTEIVGGFAFWKKYETSWIGLDAYGEKEDFIPWCKTFDNLDAAKDFLAWCQKDKVVKDEETFSAPATVVMDGVAIPATANFKVTRSDEPPQDFKGDLMECYVREDGVLEVTDFIPEKKVERAGRAPKYNREAIEDDIRSGYSVSEVAERNGVSYPTAAKIKKEMKEPDAPVKLPNNFGQMREIQPDTNVDGEIKLMFLQGFKVQEVSDMYPMVPVDHIIKLKADARA
jgi:hypothetical protein